MQIVRIKAKRDGFRRCGVAHPKAPTDHAADRFTPAELEILQADPMLSVELIEGEAPSGGSGSTDSSGSVSGGGEVVKAPAKPKATGGAKPAAKKPAAPKAPKATKAPKEPAKPPVEPAPDEQSSTGQQQESEA